MAFIGKHPCGSKIIVNNTELTKFQILVSWAVMQSYTQEDDISLKINKFQRMCGTTR
jgi:hypothetical protein